MTRMQLLYLGVIIASFRLGIEYNLYLINQLFKNYHLFDLMDCIIFILYFGMLPSICGGAFICLYESIKEDKSHKKLPIYMSLSEAVEKIIDPLVCWNCESKSDLGSIFCMTCGIRLDLKENNKRNH